MLKGFTSYFIRLDRLSHSPGLTVKGSPRFNTVSGAFFTMLAYITVGVYALLQVLEFSSFDLHGSISSNIRVKSNPPVDFKTHRILPIITSLNTTFSANDLLKYYSAQLVVNLGEKDKQEKRVTGVLTAMYVPCDTLSQDYLRMYYPSEMIKDPLLTSILNRTLCADVASFDKNFEDWKVNNDLSEDLYPRLNSTGSYQVRILPCVETGRNKCANPRDRFSPIDKNAYRNKDMALTVGNFDPSVQIENFSKPVQNHELLNEKTLYAKDDETITYQQHIVVTYIEDEFGFPMKGRNRTSYVNRYNSNSFSKDTSIPSFCKQSEVDTFSTSCPPYFILDTKQNPKKIVEVLQRKYVTPIEVLSNIGGFYTAIWLAFTILYSLLFSKYVKFNMVEQMFGFQRHSRLNCCKKSKFRFTATESAVFHPTAANYKSALKVLDDCLDVYSLVRQLTLLRMLLDFVLEPKAKELGPSTALSQHAIEEEKVRAEKENDNISIGVGSDNDSEEDIDDEDFSKPGKRKHVHTKSILDSYLASPPEEGFTPAQIANGIRKSIKIAGPRASQIQDETLREFCRKTTELLDSSSGFCVVFKRHLSRFQMDILEEGKKLDQENMMREAFPLAKQIGAYNKNLLSFD